jgi:hypothetical protein
MQALAENGILTAANIGEASLDLTLTNEAYRMLQGSVKPGGRRPIHLNAWHTSRLRMRHPLHPRCLSGANTQSSVILEFMRISEIST